MRVIALTLLSVMLGGCGPLVMIPGGELSGDVVTVPADWGFTDAVDTVQLETRPADPYSVNVWMVVANGVPYIAAGGGGESGWPTHIAADPRVRLRVGDKLYELNAVRTESEQDRAAFIGAAKQKYDFDPEEEDTDGAVLFRLESR